LLPSLPALTFHHLPVYSTAPGFQDFACGGFGIFMGDNTTCRSIRLRHPIQVVESGVAGDEGFGLVLSEKLNSQALVTLVQNRQNLLALKRARRFCMGENRKKARMAVRRMFRVFGVLTR
jgi:hypothetical protein